MPLWPRLEVPLTDLERITARTLVMIADRDMVTVAHADAMRNALPHAQLAVLPGADHGLPMERPHLVAPLILDFLDDMLKAGDAT